MKYEDDFDGLLNDALHEVREAEPRMGLEGRVLAGVRASAEERRFAWWKWAAVAAMVVLIVLGIAVRRGSKVDVVKKGTERVVVPEKKVEEAKVPADEKRSVTALKMTRRKTVPRVRATDAAVTKVPFPAPTPITEQEKALMLLARNNPGVLIKVDQERSAESIAITRIEIKEIGETR